MKIKVENIGLKTILTEEIYHSGFEKIQSGDIFTVVTNNNRFSGKVIDKFSTQIVVQQNGNNYIITNNSLDGDVLKTFQIVDGERKSATIIKDVVEIIVTRNGRHIVTLSSDEAEKEKEVKPVFKQFYRNCLEVLKNVKVDDKLTINTGELMITSDKINPQSIISIDIHVKKMYDGFFMGTITKIYGDKENKYSNVEKDYIKITLNNSLKLTNDGVNLIVKSKKNGETIIDGVYEMKIDKFFTEEPVTWDDLFKNDGFNKMVNKKPNIWGQIIGLMDKGILPTMDILKKIGINTNFYTKGKKVLFRYTGKPIREGNSLNLKSNNEYVGLFKTTTIIRLTGTKRGESLLIKLNTKINDDLYEADITFNKIINGETQTEKVGSGVIKILDSNYK